MFLYYLLFHGSDLAPFLASNVACR